MTKREVTKLFPTMKVNHDENDELSIPFESCKAVITELKDVETGFGSRIKATLSKDGSDDIFGVFVNQTSVKKLIDAYGDDDANWVKKSVTLSLEKNDKFKNKMIVLTPAK